MLTARSDQFITPRSTTSSPRSAADIFVSPRSEFVTPRDASVCSPRFSYNNAFVTPRSDLEESQNHPYALPLDKPAIATIYETQTEPETAAAAAAPQASGALPVTQTNAVPSQQDLVDQLFRSARHGHYAEIEKLLQVGIPVDSLDQHGNTILIVAAQNGNKRIAKLALRQGADINKQNSKGNTAAHYCFAFAYTELGEYLISKGANTALVNCANMTCYQGISK